MECGEDRRFCFSETVGTSWRRASERRRAPRETTAAILAALHNQTQHSRRPPPRQPGHHRLAPGWAGRVEPADDLLPLLAHRLQAGELCGVLLLKPLDGPLSLPALLLQPRDERQA